MNTRHKLGNMYPYPPKESRQHLARFAEENVGDSRLESGIAFLRAGGIPRCERAVGMIEYCMRITHKEAVRSGLGCELVRESSGNVCEAFSLWSDVRLEEQVLQIRTWIDLAADTVFATDAPELVAIERKCDGSHVHQWLEGSV